MQTKLLKKVRKRFSIIKLTGVDRPDNKQWKEYGPIYGVVDKKDAYGLNYKEFNTLPEAYDFVISLIKNAYNEYSTHKKSFEEKIRW